MPPPLSRVATLLFVCLAMSATHGAQNADPDLTAHEWGTFTSIAAQDGHAEEWLPQTGSVDLPSFIERLGGVNFKAGVRGTVRMETPVLYFYAPRETRLSVKVSFSHGLITEWYPHASHVEPTQIGTADTLYQTRKDGSVAWESVTVSPGLTPGFPHENQGPRYYAARETSSAPVVVKTETGEQHEKFLFYRGISRFSPPISATVAPNGELHLTNLCPDEIPSVILFERRGDKLGYRLGGALPGEMSLDPPELTATFESLNHDLEDLLTSQGLYPDEARAMIATWRDSWFEEGSRLFYIVPPQFVNAILPLTIHPVPSQTVRVFVGRLELITPATIRAVETALVSHDRQTIEAYGRFLQPILERMKAANPGRAAQIERDLEQTYNSGLQSPSPK